MDESKKQQVVAQCKSVAHLATALAGIHKDYVALFESNVADDIIDIVGERSAAFMEELGNMLNGMDATTEEDEWMEPVFAKAQCLWPTRQETR